MRQAILILLVSVLALGCISVSQPPQPTLEPTPGPTPEPPYSPRFNCPDGSAVSDPLLCAHYDCPDGGKAALPRLCAPPTPIPTVSPLRRVVVESCPYSITSPGEYVLETGLALNATYYGEACISAGSGSNGSTIDCQGNSITGRGHAGSFGIHIWNASGVTVRNCDVSGFSIGISLERARGNAIINSSARSGISVEGNIDYPYGDNILIGNKVDFVDITYSYNNVLYGNVVNANDHEQGGIVLNGARNETLIGNNVSGNHLGIWLLQSSNNIIVGNNVGSNDVGIDLRNGAEDNFFMNNYICGNTQDISCEAPSHVSSGAWQQTDGGNTCATYVGPPTCNIRCNATCAG